VRGERGLLARRLQHGDQVCRDSCVELFLGYPGAGYHCNIEINCIGTSMVMRVPHAPDTGQPVDRDTWAALPTKEYERAVRWQGSMPSGRAIDVQPEPIDWTMRMAIDLDWVFPNRADRARLRMNLYKCADDSPHRHWGSWSNVGERLDYHQPDRFGDVVLSD
jgi:hypothetical protein